MSESKNPDVREQLHTLKTKLALSCEELGAEVVTRSHLQDFLQGRCGLSVARLERMLAAHGLRVELVEIKLDAPTP